MLRATRATRLLLARTVRTGWVDSWKLAGSRRESSTYGAQALSRIPHRPTPFRLDAVRHYASIGGKGKPIPVYHHEPGTKLEVTTQMKNDFDESGFIIIRNLFSKEEIGKLRENIEKPDAEIMKYAYHQEDADGVLSSKILWGQPGEDYTGIMARCERMVNTCEKLLDGEVIHYHSKFVLKSALTGGAFEWHQDYGYWYLAGHLRPDMMSIQVAIDDADRENACLQVLRGSHKLGRLDHKKVGDQVGADPERVREAEKILERVYADTKVGDALAFHCNVLHKSDQNVSGRRRWSFIACYNRADNKPFTEHLLNRCFPISKVPDSSVIACNDFTSMEGKDFFIPGDDVIDSLGVGQQEDTESSKASG